MEKQLLEDISNRKLVVVRALPGIGLNTFVREIVEKHKTLYNDLVVNFFPHEDSTDLNKLLLNKIEIDNGVAKDFVSSTLHLQNYLTATNKGLVVVLNKLDYFEEPQKYLDYFDSLYRSTHKKVSLVISANLEVFTKVSTEAFKRRISSYIFSGFIGRFDEFFGKFCVQNAITNPTENFHNLVKDYSLGHFGLMLALLRLYKLNQNLPHLDQLLEDEEVKMRMLQITQSLNDAGLDIHKLILEKTYNELEILGLAQDATINSLLVSYLSKNSTVASGLYENLTSTEGAILQILENSKDKYISVDKILALMGNGVYEKSSDWAAYKHINNLNKKLGAYSLKIENKRGKGYKLITL